MNEDIKELLEEIQDWMVENDYECGEVGCHLYGEIYNILKKYDKHPKD